ncbi:hypothetical protein [Pacificibacter sp. AS14]|uniref:hypothetical protein n=1 Tax=Pacificibacter sp. AS14 TaxID=3135785 RepID=UPI00316CA4B3
MSTEADLGARNSVRTAAIGAKRSECPAPAHSVEQHRVAGAENIASNKTRAPF